MKTAIEVLKEQRQSVVPPTEGNWYSEDRVLAAMEEYAHKFAKEVVFEFCEASERPYVDSLSHPPSLNDRWEWFKQTKKGKKLFSITELK